MKRKGLELPKLPATVCSCYNPKGTLLESRFECTHEIASMLEVLSVLARSPAAARFIDKIWCDSQACATYCVEVNERFMKPCCVTIDDAFYALGYLLDQAFIEVDGGHNGITIEYRGDRLRDVDPNWIGDEV